MDKAGLVTAYSDYCVFCRLTATFVFCRLAAMCQRTSVAWFAVLYRLYIEHRCVKTWIFIKLYVLCGMQFHASHVDELLRPIHSWLDGVVVIVYMQLCILLSWFAGLVGFQGVLK